MKLLEIYTKTQWKKIMIKFRAWSYSEKRMLDWKELLFSNDRWNLYAVLTGEGFTISNFKPSLQAMQFTGVLDKNGKEIYDGDIIETSSESSSGRVLGLVRFNSCNYGEVLGWNVMEYPDSDSAIDFYYGKSPSDRDEVVGNIYETQELIKE